MMLRGTDISAYQDTIPSGDFCILKATEGLSYVDPPFASRWATLAQRGTLRGAYHFFHPSEDPVAQADFFLSHIEGAGLRAGDTLWLDHEALTLASERRTILPVEHRARLDAQFSAETRASAAQAFCSRVMDKAGRVGVYTFLSFAESGYCAGLGKYPLWMADPSRPAGQPRVPAPWTSWALHQYGEPAGVDVDVFNGDKAAWLALGGGSPTPTPQEDDDMPYGQLAEGANAISPISLPRGRYKTIGFICDNGLQKLPPAELRVAIHGSSWHVDPNVTVDSAKGQTVIVFPDIPNTDGISVQRLDAGDVRIAWEVS